MEQCNTHCSGDKQEDNKKKDEDGSSFSNTRTNHHALLKCKQKAERKTPDARNVSFECEFTPNYSVSKFSTNSKKEEVRKTPDVADNFQGTYDLARQSPSFDAFKNIAFGATPNYSASKFCTSTNSGEQARGKNPAINFAIGATPNFSTSKFNTSFNNRKEVRTPNIADSFQNTSDLGKQTPIFNDHSQQQEDLSINHDELDTSNFDSTKGRDSCDTAQHHMEAYYNIGETLFNALADLKRQGLS